MYNKNIMYCMGEENDTQTFADFFRGVPSGEHYAGSREYEYGSAGSELCYPGTGELLWDKAV